LTELNVWYIGYFSYLNRIECCLELAKASLHKELAKQLIFFKLNFVKLPGKLNNLNWTEQNLIQTGIFLRVALQAQRNY